MPGGGEPALGLLRDTSGWRRRSWLLGGGLQRRGPLLRRAHRTRLKKLMLERAVEVMVIGATHMFRDDALQARSVELKLTPTPKAASAKAKQTPRKK